MMNYACMGWMLILFYSREKLEILYIWSYMIWWTQLVLLLWKSLFGSNEIINWCAIYTLCSTQKIIIILCSFGKIIFTIMFTFLLFDLSGFQFIVWKKKNYDVYIYPPSNQKEIKMKRPFCPFCYCEMTIISPNPSTNPHFL